VLEAIRDDLLQQKGDTPPRFVTRAPVTHHAPHFYDFGDPTTVRLSIRFDSESPGHGLDSTVSRAECVRLVWVGEPT
jgi:hypothetical protein